MSDIQIDIAGATVKGRIDQLDPSGIAVHMLHPYKGLSGARFLPPQESDRNITDNEQQLARDILIDLYRAANYVEEHWSDIRPEFYKCLNRLERIKPEQADRRYERDWQQIVDKIGQGRIGINEYRWQLQTMRETKNLVDDLIRTVRNDFFDQCFPFDIPFELRESLFEYIDTRFGQE